MLRDIKSSDKIQVLGSNGEPVALGETGGQLSLTVPVINDQEIKYQRLSYYMQNNTLYRERYQLNNKRDPGDDQFLDKIPAVDKITGLSFLCPQYGVVEYQIIASENGRSITARGRAGHRVDYGLE